jgi:hypothetical protein
MAEPQTVLIRIGENGAGWEIDLFVDDGRDDWLSRPEATEPLPRDVAFGDGGVLVDEIGRMRSVVLNEEHHSAEFEVIGARLYELVARGTVAAAWNEIVQRESGFGGSGGVRLLLDVRPEELSMLPWELMCRGPRRLAVDVASPFSRVGRGFPGAGALPTVHWPLRVLVVVGSPQNDKVVAAEAEIKRLTDAFRRMCGLVDVEFQRQPSRREVRETFNKRRPHIFHFIGHGSVSEGRGQLLLYDTEEKESLPWTPPEIDTDLAGWQPRLAIINACRSTDADEQRGAWRVSARFTALGVPAVIAMQADIRGDAAAAFTGDLYKALAEDKPLDVAVAAGRAAITDIVDVEHRDFALPSLSVSAPPETVLKMGYGVSEELRPQVEHVHRRFRAFVDRTKERRQLWRGLDPAHDDAAHEPEPPPDVIAIAGGPKVGKSELARWCVNACELHGGNAAYVDLGMHTHLGYVGALEAIRNELGRSVLHERTNLDAFVEWETLLAHWDGTAAALPGDMLDTRLGVFGDALRDAAGDGPLLIALDNIGGVQADHWELLCKNLLRRVATHGLAPVRVIVVLTEEQRDTWLTMSEDARLPEPIELPSFKASEFKPVAGQYIRYRFKVDHDLLEARLEQIQAETEFDWELMRSIDQLARTWGWERY